MKKEGKTNRPFIYDLNQILYGCTVEVTNRFKGLDLIDRMPEEQWMEVHDIVQEAVIKTICKKKDVLFIIGDWNAKVGNKEVTRIAGKFGLGVQNEAGQKLTKF